MALAGVAFAQEPQPGQSEPSPQGPRTTTLQPEAPPGKAGPGTSQEGHERILGVIPAFEVTNRQHPSSLTPRQKFRLFARQSFDPFQWLAAGAQAGAGQAHNSLPGYGQGAAGYGKRYGAAVADVTDREFMSNFLFPVLLKQDPRYFRRGRGTIQHRFLYSLEQEFWGKTDQGTRQFNYSKVLGAFVAKGVSNAYYPPGDRGLGLTMRRSGISLLSGMGTGLAAEFWPDINCKLFHRCHNI